MKRGHFLLDMTTAIVVIIIAGFLIIRYMPEFAGFKVSQPDTSQKELSVTSPVEVSPDEPEHNTETPEDGDIAPGGADTGDELLSSIVLPDAVRLASYTIGLSTFVEALQGSEYCFEQGSLHESFFLTGASFSADCTSESAMWSNDGTFTLTSFKVEGGKEQEFKGYSRKDGVSRSYHFKLNVFDTQQDGGNEQ